MTGSVRLDTAVEAGVLFDYLSDITRRPEWQASLRAIDELRGAGGVGTTWRDVTAVGARPRLEVSEFDRPRFWAERGRWHGITAELRLELQAHGVARTRLTARFRIAGAGPYALPAAVLQRLAAPAIAADLRRAVRLAAAG